MEQYKKIGINNFLFGVKGFSIGYQEYNLEEIPENSYLMLNRVMDCECIANLREMLPQIKRFRGIVFEDIGVFNLLKDSNIELIWNQNHFQTNYNSINFWLNQGCSSSFISNEITEEEINYILEKSTKPLVLTIFGKNQIMYSRRRLLTNFNTYANLPNYNKMILKTNVRDNNFYALETDYGTILFNNTYFNYLKYANTVDDNKIRFYYVYNLDNSPEYIEEILKGKEVGDTGFLNKKTVYKMSQYDDR